MVVDVTEMNELNQKSSLLKLILKMKTGYTNVAFNRGDSFSYSSRV